jgi:phosphotransferase system enzyme I (PtsI)
MTRRTFAGRTASRGIVTGTLQLDVTSFADALQPASGIVGAIAATLRQLRALQAIADPLGREILDFQVELLEDDSLVTDMLLAARDGAENVEAIRAVLDEQIALFAASRSEQFAARAADLVDLRDRLMIALQGLSAVGTSFPEDTVLLCEDITPSRFLEIDWTRVRGIVAQAGSSASHAALLARARGVPMLVGLGQLPATTNGQPALLNASGGVLIIDPQPHELDQALAATPSFPEIPAEEGLGPAYTPEGDQVRLNLSLNSLGALQETPVDWCDGIGLARTELLVPGLAALHDVAVQADVYRQLFDWAEGRPVTVRLFDAGGDKPIDGFTLPNETNPFLGVRGARLLLRHPDVVRTQMRAILMAAAGRPAGILVPMITIPAEMASFRALLRDVMAALGVGEDAAMLGMMVETPAAALEIDQFDADFYTVGINDLIQYTTAVSRDSDAIDMGESIVPAVLTLIRRVVAHGGATGRDVTLCGDAASTRAQLRLLLGCGIRSLAVPGRYMPRFKHVIREGV